MQIGSWRKAAIRSVAVVNLAFAAIGYFWIYMVVTLHHEFPLGWEDRFPHPRPILYSTLALSGMLLLFLVWGSVQLLRSDSKGFRICSIVYVSELFYWFIDIPLGYLAGWSHNDTLIRLAVSMTANGTLGRGPIIFQIFSGYPIVALLALSLAFGRPPWRRQAPTSPIST